MSQSTEHLETLQSIRDIMERSQRFITLSGLSGIAAGTCGLVASYIAYKYMNQQFSLLQNSDYQYDITYEQWGYNAFYFFLGLAIMTLLAAFVSAYFFTYIKAKKQGRKVWDASSRRLAINFSIPLVTGGLVCLIFLDRGYLGIIAPLTLIFYGLACVHASKYTFEDIRYLGYCELVLGLLALYFIGYGLLFWALGFGVLHIVYGIIMYRKYD
jgi:hypothetical protein